MMKDVLLVFLVFVCAAQALHIWRLTKRRDEQDDAIDSAVREAEEIIRKADKMDEYKAAQTEARRREREGGR
jgi:hypothetical protein